MESCLKYVFVQAHVQADLNFHVLILNKTISAVFIRFDCVGCCSPGGLLQKTKPTIDTEVDSVHIMQDTNLLG